LRKEKVAILIVEKSRSVGEDYGSRKKGISGVNPEFFKVLPLIPLLFCKDLILFPYSSPNRATFFAWVGGISLFYCN
jgi:hypothetical protein